MTILSPGRINLIGEHLDYNGGPVMPASIDKVIRYEAEPIDRPVLELFAKDLDERYSLPLPFRQRTDKLWVNYLAGIVDQYQQMGFTIPGLRIEFGGNIPHGSGMSSSAALEGGMAFLLNEVLDAGLSRPELAQLCKRSSNDFLTIPSGIMDQFASLNGSAEGPILLDCETLEFHTIQAKIEGYRWVLINSMVSHELAGGEYHVRVRECEEALAILRDDNPTLPNLSAATPAQLARALPRMVATVAKRARYVVSEVDRVRQMGEALQTGDAQTAMRLLNATHAGLRDEYEVSCEEIDFLQFAVTSPGCGLPGQIGPGRAGARLMGGGFGGCTLNLIPDDAADKIIDAVSRSYHDRFSLRPEIYPVEFGPGTRLVGE